ncbi:MAG: peptidylprolyl isomerase [Alphaproteobacteria bacterium]|nr:peptidylprolyl isomerase [Alphaproteobacteria bacterium]
MVQANNGDTVQIHYTGKLKDGTEFDSSVGRDPLQVTIGENALMPKLEASIVGMALGDTQTVEIEAADAFGPRRPDAIQTVERSTIPEGVDLTVGNRLEAVTQDGQTMILTVVEVGDASVTLDSNHPLAGEDLTFEIELVAIVSPAA